MYEEFWKDYYQTMQRKGITEYAQRSTSPFNTLVIAGKSMYVVLTVLTFTLTLYAMSSKEGMNNFFTLNALMLEDRNLFIADTYVNTNPTAEQLAEMTILAAEEVRRFGITPRVALLSHSSFGSDQTDSSAQNA